MTVYDSAETMKNVALNKNQQTIEDCINTAKQYKPTDIQYHHITTRLLQWIVEDLQPLNIVNTPTFISLCE